MAEQAANMANMATVINRNYNFNLWQFSCGHLRNEWSQLM